MTGAASLVYVVDDDDTMRRAIATLLRSVAIASKAFASAQEFLDDLAPNGPCCLVLDVRLPRSSGFDVQEALSKRGCDIPIIFVTGHGTIPMTVRAMKAGAVEFLTKPFSEEELLDAVRRALERDAAALERRAELLGLQASYATLTNRERSVMRLVVSGQLNKQIAFELGTSEITIKVHRRHVMDKMQAASLADLVRMAERMEVAQSSRTDQS